MQTGVGLGGKGYESWWRLWGDGTWWPGEAVLLPLHLLMEKAAGAATLVTDDPISW